jgi:hypothetical protein
VDFASDTLKVHLIVAIYWQLAAISLFPLPIVKNSNRESITFLRLRQQGLPSRVASVTLPLTQWFAPVRQLGRLQFTQFLPYHPTLPVKQYGKRQTSRLVPR